MVKLKKPRKIVSRAVTLISCDEAGFTGPALLDPDQPHFVYASHDLDVTASDALIADIRASFRIKAAELKAASLKKRNDWAAICELVCERTSGRAIFIAFDKRVALAGKVFEYLCEPVLEDNNEIFYRVNFHRFMMNAVYEVLNDAHLGYGELAKEMQQFMRTFDPTSVQSLFGEAGGKHPVIMRNILTFCREYSDRIAERTGHLRVGAATTGKWALDLTSTSLFSLIFSGWGHRHERLRVLCDVSKPLQATDDLFAGFIDRDGEELLHGGNRQIAIRGNLAGPIEYGSSLTHPTLQVADLIAGIAAFALRNEVASTVERWLGEHMHENYVMPDPELSSKQGPTGKLGRAILKELARRSDAGEDPLDGMPAFIGDRVLRIVRRR